MSVYTVLPLSLAWALMVGIGTSVSHIIIISVYVPVTSPETPDLVVQVKVYMYCKNNTNSSLQQRMLCSVLVVQCIIIGGKKTKAIIAHKATNVNPR